jgi:hypothetical protein
LNAEDTWPCLVHVLPGASVVPICRSSPVSILQQLSPRTKFFS